MSGKMKYSVGHEFPNGKRLTEYVGSHPKFRTSMWMWECVKCGKVGGPSLTNSISRPKGPACCFQNKSGNENGRWKGYKELTGVFLSSYEYGAKKRGIEWNVTPEYIWSVWESQNGICAYTGLELVHGSTASLDRRDNALGYVEGNVQWIHRDINRMKSDFSESYFLEMCREVTKNS